MEGSANRDFFIDMQDRLTTLKAELEVIHEEITSGSVKGSRVSLSQCLVLIENLLETRNRNSLNVSFERFAELWGKTKKFDHLLRMYNYNMEPIINEIGYDREIHNTRADTDIILCATYESLVQKLMPLYFERLRKFEKLERNLSTYLHSISSRYDESFIKKLEGHINTSKQIIGMKLTTRAISKTEPTHQGILTRRVARARFQDELDFLEDMDDLETSIQHRIDVIDELQIHLEIESGHSIPQTPQQLPTSPTPMGGVNIYQIAQTGANAILHNEGRRDMGQHITIKGNGNNINAPSASGGSTLTTGDVSQTTHVVMSPTDTVTQEIFEDEAHELTGLIRKIKDLEETVHEALWQFLGKISHYEAEGKELRKVQEDMNQMLEEIWLSKQKEDMRTPIQRLINQKTWDAFASKKIFETALGAATLGATTILP